MTLILRLLFWLVQPLGVIFFSLAAQNPLKWRMVNYWMRKEYLQSSPFIYNAVWPIDKHRLFRQDTAGCWLTVRLVWTDWWHPSVWMATSMEHTHGKSLSRRTNKYHTKPNRLFLGWCALIFNLFWLVYPVINQTHTQKQWEIIVKLDFKMEQNFQLFWGTRNEQLETDKHFEYFFFLHKNTKKTPALETNFNQQ